MNRVNIKGDLLQRGLKYSQVINIIFAMCWNKFRENQGNLYSLQYCKVIDIPLSTVLKE